VEVGCPETWGLELLTPNPGSKNTPKACPTSNPATSPARYAQPKPKHPSHRARSSVEVIKILTVITILILMTIIIMNNKINNKQQQQ